MVRGLRDNKTHYYIDHELNRYDLFYLRIHDKIAGLNMVCQLRVTSMQIYDCYIHFNISTNLDMTCRC